MTHQQWWHRENVLVYFILLWAPFILVILFLWYPLPSSAHQFSHMDAWSVHRGKKLVEKRAQGVHYKKPKFIYHDSRESKWFQWEDDIMLFCPNLAGGSQQGSKFTLGYGYAWAVLHMQMSTARAKSMAWNV